MEEPAIITPDALQTLLTVLREQGYTLIGPTVRDGAIVYDSIDGLDDLPAGWSDKQDAGSYHLHRNDKPTFFDHTVGPHSWKRYLHPPRERLWRARRDEQGVHVLADDTPPTRYALLGARACELHAMAIQDKVFLGGVHADRGYTVRRADALVIAVNCTRAGGTCFCTSMQTGPAVTSGYDLALTELYDGHSHRFVVQAGTTQGAELLGLLPRHSAGESQLEAARTAVEGAARSMGRQLDTTGIKRLLQDNLEHPRWDEVATRCLTCANCTMVCPTCFCTTVEDVTDLTGEHAERWRRWDSCFTMDFSHLQGGSTRSSAKSRYRQWLTHKLAYWIDQFGHSGCVGCGRCITWCPVGIDITEEVAAIRSSDRSTPEEPQ